MAMIMMGSDVKMRAINQATKMKRLEELKKVRTKMETKTGGNDGGGEQSDGGQSEDGEGT